MLKQVIVMRNDLKMRKGKMVAQGSHASCMCLAEPLLVLFHFPNIENLKRIVREISDTVAWLRNGMTKICVRVESEAELLEIYGKAKSAKLMAHIVTDAGHTEFKGVPTKTCLAIGPNDADEIDKITGNLKLL